MANIIQAPGVGLPLPQQLYPASLYNGPFQAAGNEFSLAPGDALPVPPGQWMVNPGKYSVIQFLDPVTGAWRIHPFSAYRGQPQLLWSDGFNYRVANLTGCPVVAIVTNGGSGYVSGSTTATANNGNSVLQAVVGGWLSTIGVTAPGKGYGIAPEVFIAAPPNPGVQATAIATIASGTVSGITLVNQGAGYPSAPNVLLLPSPFDPNLNTGITNATGSATISGSGTLSAVLVLNPGVSVSAVPTLTIAGAGSSAVATLSLMQSVTSVSVVSGGGNYAGGVFVTTVGGIPNGTDIITNPENDLTNWVSRPLLATGVLNGNAIGTVSTIYDGGLFIGTPTPIIATGGGTTVASVALTLGGQNDTVFMQTR